MTPDYFKGPTGFPTIRKSPVAVLDYGRSWADWLAVDETITTATVTVADGITLDSHSISPDGKTSLAWISGGTVGTSYEVVFFISTNKGREDSRTVVIQVEKR